MTIWGFWRPPLTNVQLLDVIDELAETFEALVADSALRIAKSALICEEQGHRRAELIREIHPLLAAAKKLRNRGGQKTGLEGI